MSISTLGWIGVGVAAWLVVATVVGVVVGRHISRMSEMNDRHAPRPTPVDRAVDLRTEGLSATDRVRRARQARTEQQRRA